MSAAYTAELAKITDAELRLKLDDAVAHAGAPPVLMPWALRLARWRVGDLDTYPAPPSKRADVDAITRIHTAIDAAVDFRPRRTEAELINADPRDYDRGPRAGVWNPLR